MRVARDQQYLDYLVPIKRGLLPRHSVTLEINYCAEVPADIYSHRFQKEETEAKEHKIYCDVTCHKKVSYDQVE